MGYIFNGLLGSKGAKKGGKYKKIETKLKEMYPT
jgi:hypothetical protein